MAHPNGSTLSGFTPCLRKSRTAYSVLQSGSENEMQSELHQKLDTSLVVGGGIANHIALKVKTIGRRRIDILAITLAMLCMIELKNIPLVALYEATIGVTLARTRPTERTLRKHPLYFSKASSTTSFVYRFLESDFNPDYQNLKAPTKPRTTFATTLDEFFYHGWCDNVPGTWSIHCVVGGG